MRAARLAEAADQNLIAGLEKNQNGWYFAAELAVDGWEAAQRLSSPYVHYQGRPRDFAAGPAKFRKPRDQVHRQVIHAEVAQILERLQHRTLSRSAHAGDNDEP